MGVEMIMNKDDIEYLVGELIMDTRTITILENDIDNIKICEEPYPNYLKEQLQLLYINRELAIERLLQMGY
jgi:hypothetical protein